MDKQIVELQTRLAFQEDMIQELNAIVARQQHELDELRLEVHALAEHYQNILPVLVASPAEEMPPHY
jgi:SlyX protein